MRKKMKVLSIVMLCFCAFGLILLNISLYHPYGFGLFIMNIYEDITEDYGHSVIGMFTMLTKIMAIWTANFFIITVICLFIYANKEVPVERPEECSHEKEYKKRLKEKRNKERQMKFFNFLKKTKEHPEETKEVVDKAAETVADVTKDVTTAAVKSDKKINDFLSSLR